MWSLGLSESQFQAWVESASVRTQQNVTDPRERVPVLRDVSSTGSQGGGDSLCPFQPSLRNRELLHRGESLSYRPHQPPEREVQAGAGQQEDQWATPVLAGLITGQGSTELENKGLRIFRERPDYKESRDKIINIEIKQLV